MTDRVKKGSDLPRRVVCPYCRAVAPAGLTCIKCNAQFTAQLTSIQGEAISIPTLSIDDLTMSETSVSSKLDHRLQRAVTRMEQGIRTLPTNSTDEDEIAVIAKVTDAAAWEALSEVRIGVAIPDEVAGDTIVTARIPIQRIEFVSQQPFVKSLQAAQRLQPSLHKTIEETGARPDSFPVESLSDGGRGVIIGVIDFGCDFVHDNFRNEDGGSRILAIWDQTAPAAPGSPAGVGRVIRKDEIDAALKSEDPYETLKYAPPRDNAFVKGAHGTHVIDIAAGNGRGSSVSGMAPKADIVFVEAVVRPELFSGEGALGVSLGDTVTLLEAVRFIFDFAGDRPCVINISLGTNGGPHDGTRLVEDGIDRMLSQASNRAVVIAASNSFADGIHKAETVASGGHTDLIWRIPSNDATDNELEIWYKGSDRFAVEIIAPNGASKGVVEPGEGRKELGSSDQRVILVISNLADSDNDDNLINIFLEHGLPLGDWVIRLHGREAHDGGFHAWIERDNNGQSSFAPPHDNSHTLGSISCGRQTIVVGSYDAHKPSLPLSFFSSAGPTRDGRQKPEVSAPGHDVFAAHSRTKNGVIRKSGTSMAAPAVTGAIALILGEARARNLSLTSTQIRELIIQTARDNPPAESAWDPRFGHGRISALQAIQKILS